MTKKLLICFYSQSGHNQQLAFACYQGARHHALVQTTLLSALEVSSIEIENADALLLITAEMNGLIAGGMKEMLDRVFYPLERAEKYALPYALIMHCGNAGQSAAKQIEKIMTGIKAKLVQPALIFHGEPDQAMLTQCEELAIALAEGLTLGIF